MKLAVNETFPFENLVWTIQTVQVGANKEVYSFMAITFNGRYTEYRNFNVEQSNRRHA